jgi:hypothetical protein
MYSSIIYSKVMYVSIHYQKPLPVLTGTLTGILTGTNSVTSVSLARSQVAMHDRRIVNLTSHYVRGRM